MKTIQVTDKMYDFLMNLSHELNTQYHKGTAMPYFFQVQTTHRIAVPKGCGNEAWHYDGTFLETDEEVIDFIYSYNAEDLSKKKIQAMSSHQRAQYLKKIGFRVVKYDYEHRLENAFLTEKACEEHIRINKHNLRQPQSYLSHAFRNPELEQVLSFICKLTGGQL